MKYRLYFPIKSLAKNSGHSERGLAMAAQLSRSCLRQVFEQTGNLTLKSLETLASFFDLQLEVLATRHSTNTDYTVQAVSYKIERDGFDSWKIHVMDFVDEFRRSLDPRLIIVPPSRTLDPRLIALLASLVCHLCNEMQISCPHWAKKRYSLATPWFPSEIEALKASAIFESPIPFRANNIFVQSNFAARA